MKPDSAGGEGGIHTNKLVQGYNKLSIGSLIPRALCPYLKMSQISLFENRRLTERSATCGIH